MEVFNLSSLHAKIIKAAMNPRTTIPTTEARMLDTKAIIAEAENAAATAPIASKIIAPIPSGFFQNDFFLSS